MYWDNQAHDTHYAGKVTWNDETNSLYIDTSANPVKANYDDVLKSFNSDGKRIMQRKENTKYVFCLVENYSDKDHQSFDKGETGIWIVKSCAQKDVIGGVDGETELNICTSKTPISSAGHKYG